VSWLSAIVILGVHCLIVPDYLVVPVLQRAAVVAETARRSRRCGRSRDSCDHVARVRDRLVFLGDIASSAGSSPMACDSPPTRGPSALELSLDGQHVFTIAFTPAATLVSSPPGPPRGRPAAPRWAPRLGGRSVTTPVEVQRAAVDAVAHAPAPRPSSKTAEWRRSGARDLGARHPWSVLAQLDRLGDRGSVKLASRAGFELGFGAEQLRAAAGALEHACLGEAYLP